MTEANEKHPIAQLLDKVVEGMAKKKENVPSTNDLNILPKPGVQDIGDGVIVWRWFVGGVVIETALATRDNNQMNIEVGKYMISVKMPESDNGMYTLYEDVSKELGQALVSAWNWQHVWKLHAGDYLLSELSQDQEEITAEVVEDRSNLAPPELFSDEDYDLTHVQG